MNAEIINWEQLKVVVFDVDGTLYNQARLRKRMFFALMQHYWWQPWKLKEIQMLAHFRSEREHKAGMVCQDLESEQYKWCAEKFGHDELHLRKIVDYWMFEHPLRFLAPCAYAGTAAFFEALQSQGIKIAVYSDYPAQDKLNTMGLNADLIISSTDPEVNRLKPDPGALHLIMSQLEVSPQNCLFIGDRPELDGVCATRAGMPYLIIDKDPVLANNFYTNLTKQLSLAIKPISYESRVYTS